MRILACLLAAVTAWVPLRAQAPDPAAVVVTLRNGDVLRGVLLERDGAVVLAHPVLGTLRIPTDEAISVRELGEDDRVCVPRESADAAHAMSSALEPPAAPAATEPAEPGSFWRGWRRTVALGANGAQGNSENASLRAGLNLQREAPRAKTVAEFAARFETSRGEKSGANARLEGRHDWLPPEGGRWRPFVQGVAEYDEFKDWNERVALAGGVGYELVKRDGLLVLPRAGLGAAAEIGGEDRKVHPEGLLGVDLEHKITPRSRVFANTDSYWRLDRLPAFRFEVRSGYEVMIEPASKLLLRLGVEDRYDSAVGDDRRKNDLTYFALLGWEF
jgi:putative salt-induced outer membrane protein YdiY